MSFFASLFSSEKYSATQINTILELTNYVASLSSNTVNVDPFLDEVRRITATTNQPQVSLPADDNLSLINVYLQIEEYLITKEPVRSFSKDELRAHVVSDLRQEIEGYEINLKKSHNA